MRINKYMAECGVGSRRACDEIIKQGRVRLNNRTVEQLGVEVKEHDKVFVDGEQIKLPQKPLYYIMNKPKGVITSTKDDKGRQTVTDILGIDSRVYPVGRLDYDTEGLLILTSDGELCNRLTHPVFETPKTFIAKVEGHIGEDGMAKLRSGVMVDGVMTKKCRVRLIEVVDNMSRIEITVTLGVANIKKMFEAVGKTVVFLKQTAIGDLKLRELKRGEFRKLSEKEINYLKGL